MRENKIFFVIGALTLILLFGVVFLANIMSNSARVTVSADASAEVKVTTYDWGEIGINNGKVDAYFEIKSTGKQTLKLFNITTSCACTSAQTIVDDKVSPLFGMHAQSAYVTDVPPGKIAKIKATFDPLFHGPNGLGVINRQVTLSTNDPKNPKLTLFMSAQVIK